LINYIYDNGELLPESHSIVLPDNRSFRYGDGLFESIRVFDLKIPLLEKHLARLTRGMSILKMNPHSTLTLKNTQDAIEKLVILNNAKNARVRLMVYRNGGGLYAPDDNDTGLMIECKAMEGNRFHAHITGLTLGYFTDIPKIYNTLSAFKTNNALPYVLAGIHARQNDLDECLVLNQFGRVAESIYSNVFIVQNNQLISPPISEGGIDGVMRQHIIKIAEENALDFHEKKIEITDLGEADEIILSNSIKGIQWVKFFEGKKYDNIMAQFLVNRLNEKLARMLER